MSKQAIISALEETFGEYVLNISKDDLKIAALRGKIVLENVQLDGDMIGGHIFGMIGLSGFGVLSCAAKSIHISVPWKNLEREPTRFEVRGIHLVCIPLIPSTANRVFGTGTKHDPLCTLRTRAKRLALSRFERNFWNGQIAGEGPPMQRVSRAVREVEKNMRKTRRRLSVRTNKSDTDSDLDDAMDSLVNDLADASVGTSDGDESVGNLEHLPELPRDWKVKLREKVLRNMEASVYDTHIRCEIPCQPDQKEKGQSEPFSFGFALECFVLRTANEKWQVGSHDKKNPADGSRMSSALGHLGPNEYLVKNNKIGSFKNLSIYWDDNPPILLSESDALQGNSRKLSIHKIVGRVATAMRAMFNKQHPGTDVVNSLSNSRSRQRDGDTKDSPNDSLHNFVCEGVEAEIWSRSSDRTQPGPVSCSADVLPCEFDFEVTPSQLLQYQSLKLGLKSQQRSDTMFRKRPPLTAKEDPRAWWRYAINCVTARPNSRAWEDIKLICNSRPRYVALVSKKNTKGNRGFHAGLSDSESAELLALEELLPIEALLAFHLLALRKLYGHQVRGEDSKFDKRSPSKSLSPFRILRGRKADARTKTIEAVEEGKSSSSKAKSSSKQMSLFDAMSLRLGKKVWYVDLRLHDGTIRLSLRNPARQKQSLSMVLRTSGRVRMFGKGRRDFFFDIHQCDLNYGNDGVLFTRVAAGEGIEEIGNEDLDEFLDSDGALPTLEFCDKTQGAGLDLKTSASFLDFPPFGTLCRIAAGRSIDAFKLSISAHPLTFIWDSSFIDCVTDFIRLSQPGSNFDLSEHIRNAATPLARKAQLAFLSPASSSLHINVAAPKIWIPVQSKDVECALFVDAGIMRLVTQKNEGSVEADWEVKAADLQVNFVRGYDVSRMRNEPLHVKTHYKADSSVIQPFSVHVQSEIRDQADMRPGAYPPSQVRFQSVVISPICLSLVDAEILARSFGKLYSRGIRQLRSREGDDPFSGASLISSSVEEGRKQGLLIRSGIPREISLSIEKIEVVVEGHSKLSFSTHDERSFLSLDDSTIIDIAPPVRTYLVEIFRISLERTVVGQLDRSKATVQDVSIVRLRDGSLYTPMKANKEVVHSENIILQCAGTEEGVNQTEVLCWSFLRDGIVHLDEVELDINAVTLRVTPTTLKDCTKAIRRIAELAQLTTKEMERKVHEAGRKARMKKTERQMLNRTDSPTNSERPLSPSLSEENSMVQTPIERKKHYASDSSILFKITLNRTTILAGRQMEHRQKTEKRPQYAVIQILSNALVMFQSIENPDGTGNKTLHVSLDNLSSLVNNEFERVVPSQAPPMIGPFGSEFRIVYATENLGCVVSQDVSLDCEKVKSRLTPNDFSIMINILRRLYDRLRAFGSGHADRELSTGSRSRPFKSLVRYQKKGTGIATSIRLEVHAFSFVLLRAFKSHSGAPELLDFNVQQIKLMLEGCVSALSGDCSAQLSINSFNSEVEEWEYAVEPFLFIVSLEQMPNELFVSASNVSRIQLNLTGVMLRDLAEMKFDILRDRGGSNEKDNNSINPSVLSTVGLRRATETRSIKLKNTTGLELEILLGSGSCETIPGDAEVHLDGFRHQGVGDDFTVSLRLSPSARRSVGERVTVHGLPVAPLSRQQSSLHLFKPEPKSPYTARGFDSGKDSRSPGEVLSERGSQSHSTFFADPVVEWCMQNQRLSLSVADVFSLDKGKDLLSNEVWSLGLVERKQGALSNWSKPFLKSDTPEWSDMTCTMRMAQDRVMLPDSSWFWVNEWSVDLCGKLGVQTDADGWEYQGDFETFNLSRRFYTRGDACRRRRWTRTRMMLPPQVTDPRHPLKFIWETVRDETGNVSVTVRSCLRIINRTDVPLTAFMFSPSWDRDELGGRIEPYKHLDVPLRLASAVYMRLARASILGTNDVDDNFSTERFTIIPTTSQSSSNYIRTSMDLKDVSGTILHHLVERQDEGGAVTVTVEPVFRVVNLSPCQLECQVGQVNCSDDESQLPLKSSLIAKAETISIPSGKEGCCTAVDPTLLPHISLKVPGYCWSSWKRIVNRKSDSDTWRPSEAEEDLYYSFKGDSDFAEEITTMVVFRPTGKRHDPLVLLLSVECGHCPVLRVYSQYWIVDKSGFGCRFSDGFNDMMSSNPVSETSRRSYLRTEDHRDRELQKDMQIPGHQWSIGMHGMTMYFSKREKLTLCIEASNIDGSGHLRTKWISALDISNVMPKTVFSVEELHGLRYFELAFNVTVCPGVFGRTKMITLFPRYQVVNLLHRELLVAQDGCLEKPVSLSSQSSAALHWSKASLPFQVRIGAPSHGDKQSPSHESFWSLGIVQVDKIGFTSMRLPTATSSNVPMVVQVEVRLATKDQPSAVVVVIWSATEKTNPHYMLRNRTMFTIICRQPINDDGAKTKPQMLSGTCSSPVELESDFDCGSNLTPAIRSILGINDLEEYVWALNGNSEVCFGFDFPERPHVLEWACVANPTQRFDTPRDRAFVEVDEMGTTSSVCLPGNKLVRCTVKAEHSTKVIEFVQEGTLHLAGFPKRDNILESLTETNDGSIDSELKEEHEDVSFGIRLRISSLLVSVVDNADPLVHGREILVAQAEDLFLSFSQTREGYHEFECTLGNFQVDNHVRKSIHPILIFCPQININEPLLHMSAVRRIQLHSNTFVFRYAAIRLLEIEIYLDRRTAETVARFIEPLTVSFESQHEEADWITKLTLSHEAFLDNPNKCTSKDIESMIQVANSGRIYFEQLHLHPVRLGLTFTQEWMDWNPGADGMMLFQFIRGMASIANAPLVFTSFVVGHVFEAPQTLMRIIATHYSSQLTKQIFGILGSLAILGAPADFISNVGSGVRDFFYEPISGAVHGPRQFIEGLEAGTQSLARGVFVGVVRGAANVTEAVNANLAGLTADDDFIDERRAHQRMMTDAMSRAATSRTFSDSLYLAGASVARSFRSGALGIVEQPSMYASKHGPVGFVKGMGKAFVGALVKPVVGVGDAAVLVMNHMSDATSKKRVIPKIPIRIRRALPRRSTEKLNSVRLEPFDERAAKAQKIVTGGETLDDVYLGHIDVPNHLIIASEQCFWAIDRRSREPWCVDWEEISHFGIMPGGVRIVIFSQTGLKTYMFLTESNSQSNEVHRLLCMQREKMANPTELHNSAMSGDPESLSRRNIPGVRARQVNHVFGSFNNTRRKLGANVKDEIDLVEQCFSRVRVLASDSPTYFKTLDDEAWSLISHWGQLFSGLNSRRCIVASIINGTGGPLQVKSSKLLEGGSPCYSIPSKELDTEQGILHAGGSIIFFAWGVGPNLLQAGNVFIHIETGGFICYLADHKNRATYAKAMPGYQVGFLEKSYDDSGWWAKYWILVRISS